MGKGRFVPAAENVPVTGDRCRGDVVDGRFELIRRLGRGSSAVVWIAADHGAGNIVALKLMHRGVLHRKGLVENAKREIYALEAMNHPAIAKPIACNLVDGCVYVAMEIVDGVSMDRWLGSRRLHVSSADALTIMDQLTVAVAHAHARGIIHRDLKPHNVSILDLGNSWEVKVLDFGVARFTQRGRSDATTHGRRIGSLFYMSPEQYRGHPADERSDVFALGTMLFEILTLHRAWARCDRGQLLPAFNAPVPRCHANTLPEVADRIMLAPRPHPRAVVPALPEALDAIVVRAMARDPSERYGTVDALRQVLIPVLRRLTKSPTHPILGAIPCQQLDTISRPITARPDLEPTVILQEDVTAKLAVVPPAPSTL